MEFFSLIFCYFYMFLQFDLFGLLLSFINSFFVRLLLFLDCIIENCLYWTIFSSSTDNTIDGN